MFLRWGGGDILSELAQNLLSFFHWGIDAFHMLVARLVDVVGALGYPG